MENFFKGKTAVVTGAGSGIGRAIAVELAKSGAQITLAGRREGPLQELSVQLGEIQDFLVCPTDVTIPEETALLAEKTVATFGQIDLLFNCAGVFQAAGFGGLPIDAIKEMMEINFMGTVNALKAVIPYMQKRQQGRIVNISSLGGKYPYPGSSAYSATKYAVAGLSNALRQELKHEGIYLTVVYPSFVSSPLLDGHLQSVRASSFYRATSTYSPEQTAKPILKAAIKKKRELVIPRVTALTPALYGLFPGFFDVVIGRLCGGWPRYDEPL